MPPKAATPSPRPAFQALAEVSNYPAQPLPAGPLLPEAPKAAERLRNPAMAQYRRLIDEIATNVNRDIGWYDVKQVRPLSNAERAAVIRANPDVLNDFPLDAEQIALIFEGSLDARLWLAAGIEGAVRKWVFDDVTVELEADAKILRANRADDLAEARRR